MDSIENRSPMLIAFRFSSVLLIFSSSIFEVLNPNYSNSLYFDDQETFTAKEDMTIASKSMLEMSSLQLIIPEL